MCCDSSCMLTLISKNHQANDKLLRYKLIFNYLYIMITLLLLSKCVLLWTPIQCTCIHMQYWLLECINRSQMLANITQLINAMLKLDFVGLSSHPGSQNCRSDSDGRPKSHRLLHTYVSYSIPMKLRKYSNPPFPAEDPELDVEAQFASHVVREAQKRIEKKKRLQCLSGWLWCKCARYCQKIWLYTLLNPCWRASVMAWHLLLY